MKARKLLADAGYPNGIDTEIACKPDPAWEVLAVQAMVEQGKEAGIRIEINNMRRPSSGTSGQVGHRSPPHGAASRSSRRSRQRFPQ